VSDLDVELVLNFANTHVDRFGRVERFDDAAGLSAWLTEHGFAEAAADVSEADAASARELRDALIALLLSHADDADVSAKTRDQAEDFLFRTASRYPLVSVVDHGGARLIPAHGGLPGAFGSLFAAITALALMGSWNRLKACRNRGCHFAFFDRTRNGSGAYCSGTCGSQVAMRRYRQRRRETS
jgi:predicted RNA-binding Zn ribbon-like protein